ncbi:MAG: hypothetical protein U0975_15460 [Erythrobacter sp.]|nr:hypothetical protein [Erythrobacter sp.]
MILPSTNLPSPDWTHHHYFDRLRYFPRKDNRGLDKEALNIHPRNCIRVGSGHGKQGSWLQRSLIGDLL